MREAVMSSKKEKFVPVPLYKEDESLFYRPRLKDKVKEEDVERGVIIIDIMSYEDEISH